jgi:hypothetical protein
MKRRLREEGGMMVVAAGSSKRETPRLTADE